MKIDILKVFSLLIIQPWHAVKVDDSDEDARNDGDEDAVGNGMMVMKMVTSWVCW